MQVDGEWMHAEGAQIWCGLVVCRDDGAPVPVGPGACASVSSVFGLVEREPTARQLPVSGAFSKPSLLPILWSSWLGAQHILHHERVPKLSFNTRCR